MSLSKTSQNTNLDSDSWVSSLWRWLWREKVVILWTTLISLLIAILSIGLEEFPKKQWFSKVIAGTASTAIIVGLLQRLNAASKRERADKAIVDIHALVAKSEAVLSKREMLLETEMKIEQFKQFLKRESYHNIRFPKLKSKEESFGLEYTIRPVRHPETNEPVKYETEMDMAYVVFVEGPSHIQVMSEETLKEYADSPIRDGEYAFCKFYNDSWYLSYETFPVQYEFYMSGKVGPVEYGQTANQFMQSLDNQIEGKTLISTILLDLDGALKVGFGACERHEIYKDKDDNLYLRIGFSQPKLMYYTNPKDAFLDKDWFFVIEDIRGYASGEKLKNIISSVLAELNKLNVQPKKVYWFNTKTYKYEPPS